jgi:25S rRNA (uracil2843-N3)-methyltransferase
MGPKGKKHSKGRAANKPTAPPKPQSSHMVTQPANSPRIPIELQQLMLNIFRDALPISADCNLKQTIQDVKGHLYNRDFASAFGAEHFLHTYALRWSASRALAYADIFAGLDLKHRWSEGPSTAAEKPTQNVRWANVLCIGGGAGAEVVALAAIANLRPSLQLSITAVDVADWSTVFGKLNTAITTPPVLSDYASAAKRGSNQALLDSTRFDVDFSKLDILECSAEHLELLVTHTSVVTIMFTLNELFSGSVAKTTAFLLLLTELMKPESWLLVVDSPGSYSQVSLGKDSEPKHYPMKWLLDHTLLQMAGGEPDGTGKWRKHMHDDSRWFRINDNLRYALELESMRYQLHLYQRQPIDQNAVDGSG